MGIKRFQGVLGNYKIKSFETKKPFRSLFSKRVAVDVSIYAYKGIYSEKMKTNAENIPNIICKTILDLLFKLLRESIYPIFVFDPPLESKRGGISRESYKKSQDMLAHLGIPFLIAAREAEALCCRLFKTGLVSAILTTDTDVLLFDCPYIVFSSNHLWFMEVSPQAIREHLQLSSPQFLDLALLLGTDFSDPWKEKGPKAILNAIREFMQLEDIPLAGYLKQRYIQHRKNFQLDSSCSWHKIDQATVNDILARRYLEDIFLDKLSLCRDEEDVEEYLTQSIGLSKTVSRNRTRKLFDFKRNMSFESLLWMLRIPVKTDTPC